VRRTPFVALLLCWLLLPLAGCGGGGGDDDSEQRNRGGAARNVDPVPKESVDDVIDRVRGASTASECEAVKGLLHSTYGDVSDATCEAVRTQIDGFRDPHGATYKTGAVIDYDTLSGQRRMMVLALDGDGTYRVAFITDVPRATIGTPKPGAFDRNATAVVRAMQAGDCTAFLRLVSRSVGLGVGPDEEVCRRVTDVPFRRELVSNGGARPVPLGGNANVAFYKLRTRPDAYYTLIMLAEPPRGGQPPRYVLVNAYPVD
jgi:hypothetical protein